MRAREADGGNEAIRTTHGPREQLSSLMNPERMLIKRDRWEVLQQFKGSLELTEGHKKMTRRLPLGPLQVTQAAVQQLSHNDYRQPDVLPTHLISTVDHGSVPVSLTVGKRSDDVGIPQPHD
jgi:hypothetical protein